MHCTIADCGSMNEAAKQLFISQPSLSETMKELETEIGLDIFLRSNRGIVITPEGEEFLGYARQVTEQFGLLQSKYIDKKVKEKFSVSTQHYTFAVKAFVETVKQIGMEQYEFAVHETTTISVIENVKNFKSEIGVLYENDFNEKVLNKSLRKMGGICGAVFLRYICIPVVRTSAGKTGCDHNGRTGMSIRVFPLTREKIIPCIWRKR